MPFRSSIANKAKRFKRKRYARNKRRLAKMPVRNNVRYLASKVNRIARKIRGETVWLNTTNTEAQDQSQNTLSPFVQIRLTSFANQAGILGTDADDLEGTNVWLKKLSCHTKITMENPVDSEEETQHFSLFFVQLKDTAGDLIDRATGRLTLVGGQDYFQLNGYSFLNKEKFIIHHYKHFSLTNNGQNLNLASAQTQFGTCWEGDFKINCNQLIKPNVQGSVTAGTLSRWKNNFYQSDPSQNYYILLFNDDSASDVETCRLENLLVTTLQQIQ